MPLSLSDTGMPSVKHPALTYSLRGIIAFEIKLHGPSRDLHSGLFGGAVDNPAMALAQLLARIRDKNGRITIPGFYDGVAPLSKYERKQAKRFPMKDRDLLKLLGSPQLFGEKGFSPLEQRTARPTFEINGLTSGYQGKRKQNHRSRLGQRQNHLSPRAQPKPGAHPQAGFQLSQKNVPAHLQVGNRGRARRGSLSRFARRQTRASRAPGS